MRKSHVVTLGLGAGMAAMAAGFAGCGTNTFGTCQDNNECPADGGGEGSTLDGTSGQDSPIVVDAGDGGDASDGGKKGDGGGDGSLTDAPKGDAPSEGGGSCEAGAVSCSGACTDTSTDPNNCGSCGVKCPGLTNGSATCAAGTDGAPACGFTCSPMFHSCSGACDPNSDTPSMSGTDPCILTTTFGVFVSPAGNDSTGDGSPGNPYQTLGHAMDQAVSGGTKRVYACGSAGPYVLENLNVGASRDGVSVFGGLDCTTNPSAWTYDASDVASVTPAAAGYALQVSALTTGVSFTDFAFTSLASSGAGASSIAVFVSSSTGVSFTRVAMTAGDASGAVGAAGASGGTTGDPSNHLPAASLNGNSTGDSTGASDLTCTCPIDMSTSTGGSGGDSSHTAGDGEPSLGGGTGGSNGDTCATGGTGANGDRAPMGIDDTPSTSLGTLSATGWTPATGAAASGGNVGQGGGGGGEGLGGGGGGGACGGCGGVGGAPGAGGGSSIALLSFDASVTITSCSLTAHNAAMGGLGGNGEQGQVAGFAGNGGAGGCAGGPGGDGAGGNGAQGGPGGLSLGVGYSGTMPALDSQTTGAIVTGQAGAGGPKGTAGLATVLGNPGADGATGQAGMAQNILAL